jgi:sortase system peptidoglycan-associated protein
MKKTIIISSIIAAFNMPAYADSPSHARNKAETTGFGVGAVVGTLLGGFPGLIIGAAGGAMAAREAHENKQIDSAETELAVIQSKADITEHELIETETKLKLLEKKLTERGVANQASLTQRASQTEGLRYASAIENGFAVTIQFKTGSSEIESRYRKQIDELAHAVSTMPAVQVNLEGHADCLGGEEANQKLSEKRVTSVEALFSNAGIDKTRIQSAAFGKQHSTATLKDNEGRFFDRRVVITFKINKNIVAGNL